MRTAFGERFDVPIGYLNTASIGIPAAGVADAVAGAVAQWRVGESRPPQYDEDVATARAGWARLVGVEPDRVASGASVSQLVGLIAASVPDGTRVLTVDNEFTSVTFPFAAQDKRGVTVTEVSADRILDAAEDHDLVAVSVVQSADGAIADLAALRRCGRPVLFDVTQAAGWLPMALDWADYVVGGSYKWLFAPRGAAWLAVREDAPVPVPHVANWYGGEERWDSVYGLPLRLAPGIRGLDLSPVWFAQVGAAVSTPWLANLDLAAVRDHCAGLADTVRAEMGLPATGSAIVSLDLTPDQAARLASSGVVSSLRAGRTRLSFHLYNTGDDVDRVLGALATR
ncbi:aminotransferase class V-fold PLP-dependent enzyme [Actinophytocola oryzae]|uniref:Selenocysteine lyase/cysteine desulfurase n=1 Tax=Actinophytocola oryzae TaxID=502181 RepID=A0A4R7VBH0_9PSEU|nr:aminotransferase class V-fold PLP-dependent enzyme [Actinophytocola oryzae]TDV46404.1 selenocysteine lyase/cysteine desulfurase [Actinophytocola oryzae]